MTKLSKVAVLSTSLFLASVVHAQDPTASVVWQGAVPSSIAGTSLIITGLGGNENIDKGTLNVLSDGTFTSSVIIVEAHNYDDKKIGDLVAANWKLVSLNLTMGNTNVSQAKVELKVNDAIVALGDIVPDEKFLALSVLQNAVLANANGQAQVQVTLVASIAS